jgi:class 3 adenylate cyclase/predicted ATPase
MSEIRNWLDSIGLGQYANTFETNDIDTDLLRQVDDQTLKDIGIASAGHRLRIRNAIAKLGPTAAAEANLSSAAPQHETTVPSAERRQLTVMFCDLVGSTALSARLDPEDMREVIRAYQNACSGPIDRYDGVIAKFMGDGILAYFGFPHAHEDDAERAVRAGLEMIGAVAQLRTPTKQSLLARIGIATGLVVVGDLVGKGAAQEQAVVGETPNLAARLQALAEGGKLVVAATTRRLLGRTFSLRSMGHHELKGFTELVEAWEVEGVSSSEGRFEAARMTGLTDFVGRQAESNRLMELQRLAWQGQGQFVLVSGEPGIGKSRIAAWLGERVAEAPHARVYCQCSPYHRDSTLHPFIGQIERAADFKSEDSHEMRLDKLETLLARGTANVEATAPLIAALLTIPTGERYAPLNLSPAQQRRQTLAAILDQLGGLVHRQPMLFIFEDAHWADPTSLELLDLAVNRFQDLPFLGVITFRPEFKAPWVDLPGVSTVRLARLEPNDVRTIVDQVAGGWRLPSEIMNQIVQKTDGIPLFVEELTKTVVESGLVHRTPDGYNLTGPLPSLAIPATLHDSLVARLDRLSPIKVIAQTGAAIGREFSYALLERVVLMEENALRSGLAQLETAELVFCEGRPPEAIYVFKHALVRDAAYQTLLRSSRQQLHARIAFSLEHHFPDTIAAAPEVLAQHYTAAGMTSQAIPYWHKAGQSALQRSALAEAISHLTKGLELLRDIANEHAQVEVELGLQATLALALATAKGFAAQEVEQAYARARTLCDQIGDAPQLFPALYGLTTFDWCRGRLGTARDRVKEVLIIAERTGDPALLLIAHAALGAITWHIGDNRTALSHLRQAYGFYDEKVHASLASSYGVEFGVMTLCFTDSAQLFLGHPDRSSQAGTEVLALARRLQHPVILCGALGFQVTNVLYRRDAAALLKLADECIALAGELGFPHWVGMATAYRGWALAQLGAATDGIQEMLRGIATWRATGADIALGCYLSALSESQLVAGQAAVALETADEALIWVEKNSEGQWESLARCCKGDALCELGAFDRGRAEYEMALSAARRREAKWWELRVANHFSRLLYRQGKVEEARSLLAPAYEFFKAGFELPDLKDAKTLLDELT